VTLYRRLLGAAGGGSFVSGGEQLNLISVKGYGAVGNGSTDDTTAINAAIAARNASAGAMLYFPAGTYKITGDLTKITTPGLIFGDNGVTGQDYSTGAGRTVGLSIIEYDTETGTAFTVGGTNGTDVTFANLVIRNRNATTPTAGAGIAFTYATDTSDPSGRLDFDDAMVDGFYDNIDYQGGTFWTAFRLHNYNAVRYGMKIQNVANQDWGMWALTNCFFLNYQMVYDTAAFVRLEGSGGGKITGCNFISGRTSPSYDQSCDRFIDIVGGGTTSSLVVANCQMEAFGIDAVRSVGSWPFQTYSNIEAAMYEPNTTGHIFNISNNNDVIITNVACNSNVSGGATGPAIELTTVTRGLVAHCTNNGWDTLVTGNDLP
jgi:hypothetical protein